jgi:hypothetical protein
LFFFFNIRQYEKSFDSQKSDFSSGSNESSNPSLITKYINELLQELYTFFLNINDKYETHNLYKIINNFLFEYDLDPNNIFKILTSNYQNIICYSSLIGFFYQYGLNVKLMKLKHLKYILILLKIIINRLLLDQFSFIQKNETIIFYNVR